MRRHLQSFVLFCYDSKTHSTSFSSFFIIRRMWLITPLLTARNWNYQLADIKNVRLWRRGAPSNCVRKKKTMLRWLKNALLRKRRGNIIFIANGSRKKNISCVFRKMICLCIKHKSNTQSFSKTLENFRMHGAMWVSWIKEKNGGSKTTSVNSCAVLREADIRGWLLTLYVFCKLLKPMLSML